jgi:hypothetical protein
MIWTPERNAEQGRLIAQLYAAAASVPRERHAIMAAGLPGADRRADAAPRRGREELRQDQGYGGRYIPAEAIRAVAGTSTANGADPAGEAWYPGGGEVSRLIGGYQVGRLRLDDLAGAFRSRAWSAVAPDWAADLGAASDAVDDLEPVIAGTFDDVVHACDCGALTGAGYAVLAEATASARR